MAIITLTTDFGEKDGAVGAVKGAIYSALSDARIVDISHNIAPFNTLEAAYVIKSAYSSFPKGSIHIIGIDAELNPENKHIAVKLNGHYFICANNGIMSLICAETNPDNIVEVNIHDRVETMFPVLDILVNVACHIARGGTLEVIGKPITEIKPTANIKPYTNNDNTKITGRVIYIDNYGNVVTNIMKPFFERLKQNRSFTVNARNNTFKSIKDKYSDVVNFNIPKEDRNDEGKGLAIFNTIGHLEIAIYKSNTNTIGGASTLLGLKMLDTVTITFNN